MCNRHTFTHSISFHAIPYAIRNEEKENVMSPKKTENQEAPKQQKRNVMAVE